MSHTLSRKEGVRYNKVTLYKQIDHHALMSHEEQVIRKNLGWQKAAASYFQKKERIHKAARKPETLLARVDQIFSRAKAKFNKALLLYHWKHGRK